jgi:RecA-family ATPase
MLGTSQELFDSPDPDNPEYITRGVLPKRGVLLLGGPAKSMKSFLMLDMARSLATGGCLWGLEDFKIKEPVPVLYIDAEVGHKELRRRLKLRPKPPLFHWASEEKGLYFDTLPGTMKLKRLIDQTKVKVVIIDPLTRCLMGEESDAKNIGGMFNNFYDLLNDRPDMSIVLSYHIRKPSQDDEYDPLSPYNLRGSAKFFDIPDSLILVYPITKQNGEWARLRTGWTLRQAESPEPIELSITAGGMVKEAQRRSSLVEGAGPAKGKHAT